MAVSGGTIAGIIVVGVIGVFAVIAVIFFLVRWYLNKNKKKKKSNDVEKGTMAKENRAFDNISENIPKIQKPAGVKLYQPRDVVRHNGNLETLDVRRLPKGKGSRSNSDQPRKLKSSLKTRTKNGYEPSDSDTSWTSDANSSAGSVMLPVPSPHDPGSTWITEAGSTNGLPPNLAQKFYMPSSKPKKSSSKQNSSQSSIASSQKPLAASSPVAIRTIPNVGKVNSSIESSCTEIEDNTMGARNQAFIPDNPPNRGNYNDQMQMYLRTKSDSDAPYEGPSETISSRHSEPPFGRNSPSPDKVWSNFSSESSRSKKVSFEIPEKEVNVKKKVKLEDLNAGQLQRIIKSAPYIPHSRSRPKRRSFGKGTRSGPSQPKSNSLPPQHRMSNENSNNNSGYSNPAHNTSNQSVETDV
ncbi:DgyrCDS6445 [Dimorphilus gyrociliatus]|uniref:DgyrCDS6445 n=1 Tax=Dimorphilus gyrociliatus TaxID=2664684 RepID=A0A7I8VPM6_9ANNE|nr:DgyrCDS6445 [Dimorphilus gyrociliatus]